MILNIESWDSNRWPNFSVNEFKCKCGCESILFSKDLLDSLQDYRDRYGSVIITSGYRSEALCEAIGSKKTSQHTKGQAVDFEVIGVPNIQVAYWIQGNVDFDQLILEYYSPDDGQKGWVHVSYNEKGDNRKQVLTYDGKKYENNLPDMKWKNGVVVE